MNTNGKHIDKQYCDAIGCRHSPAAPKSKAVKGVMYTQDGQDMIFLCRTHASKAYRRLMRGAK